MCNFDLYSKNIKTGGNIEMKKEKIGKQVLKLVEKVARTEVERNIYDWPPICIGIYHQPKRPKNK